MHYIFIQHLLKFITLFVKRARDRPRDSSKCQSTGRKIHWHTITPLTDCFSLLFFSDVYILSRFEVQEKCKKVQLKETYFESERARDLLSPLPYHDHHHHHHRSIPPRAAAASKPVGLHSSAAAGEAVKSATAVLSSSVGLVVHRFCASSGAAVARYWNLSYSFSALETRTRTWSNEETRNEEAWGLVTDHKGTHGSASPGRIAWNLFFHFFRLEATREQRVVFITIIIYSRGTRRGTRFLFSLASTSGSLGSRKRVSKNTSWPLANVISDLSDPRSILRIYTRVQYTFHFFTITRRSKSRVNVVDWIKISGEMVVNHDFDDTFTCKKIIDCWLGKYWKIRSRIFKILICFIEHCVTLLTFKIDAFILSVLSTFKME